MASSQRRAVAACRNRLSARGLARFEVLGREADRALIRAQARRHAEQEPEAAHLRNPGDLCRWRQLRSGADDPACGAVRTCASVRRRRLGLPH
jgi:hypothetical protein